MSQNFKRYVNVVKQHYLVTDRGRLNSMSLSILLILVMSLQSNPADAASKEFQLKAVFLYQFAKFVKWPADLGDSIIIGVYGQDPFGDALEKIKGKISQGKPIAIKRISTKDSINKCCHIIFFSASEQEKYKELLGSLKGMAILTVGDQEGFISQGGMIRFVRKGTKLKFEINKITTDAADLVLSSKLLNVANNVIQKLPGGLQ